MSMLSAMCGRLRERAEELRILAPDPDTPYIVPSTKETMALAMGSAASEMECAADIICELSNKLAGTVDERERVRLAEAENAKLREAVATAIKVQAVLCGNADSPYCRKECPLHRQESDDCLACDVIGVAQELGIEVDA